MLTYGYIMHYALSLAKERFSAVSESTMDTKVRRKQGMFPLLKINLLKPFSPHSSTRGRRHHIHWRWATYFHLAVDM